MAVCFSSPICNLQDNFQRIYEKVDKKIGTWIRYGLTFQGKITVAKSLLLSQYTYIATILDSNDKKITDKVQAQIDLFVYHNKAGSKDNSSFQKWIHEDIYQGGKAVGGFKMINIEDFFKSLLDKILGVEPHERMSIINRGAKLLTSTEFLKTLQFIQQKWITPLKLVTIIGNFNPSYITLTSTLKS